MRMTTFLCALLFFISAFSQEKNNNLKSINELLLEKEDAIILSDENVCKVKNIDELEYSSKVKIQINNKKGEEYNRIILGESDFIKIENIKATIYDLEGNKIKKLKNDDIQESTLSPDYILYNKNKNKWFELSHFNYPYIIEYSYKQKIKSLFFWPDWYPQSDIPVLSSSYKLILKEPIKYKTLTMGLENSPSRSKENGDSVFIWQTTNISARVVEDFMPPENKQQMWLLFAPEEFHLGDSYGSLQTWDSVAEWYRQLAKDRYNLPLEAQNHILDLTKNEPDLYEKIRILYKYLQSQMRYVAIYMDIGGWQPHSASSTFNNCYGDCKDLTTLMIAMLDAINIKAYPALALTRDRGIVYDEFSTNQFNHCIAFVPLQNDTLWLECTADFLDIKEIPYSIRGIKTLVVKENEGKIIQTPATSSSRNRWLSFIEGNLLLPNSINIKSQILTTGLQKSYFKTLFEYGKSEDEIIALQNLFTKHVPNLTINQFNFEETGQLEKIIKINFDGIYKRAFSKSGNRIFINPNFFNRKTSKNIPDEKIEERKFAIHFSYPYQDIDTVKIGLPIGYTLEAAPKEIELDHSFARYKITYKFDEQTLFYIREFEYKTNHFSKEIYQEFLSYLKTVVKTDKAMFVFKKG